MNAVKRNGMFSYLDRNGDPQSVQEDTLTEIGKAMLRIETKIQVLVADARVDFCFSCHGSGFVAAPERQQPWNKDPEAYQLHPASFSTEEEICVCVEERERAHAVINL